MASPETHARGPSVLNALDVAPVPAHPRRGPVWARCAPFRPRPIARSLIERRTGTLLRAVSESEAHRVLGYARFGDYVAERLGISPRTAQEMMRTEKAFEALPRVALAFESEEITSGHVRFLTRVASPTNEASWLALARTMSVRELAEAAKEARKRAHFDEGGTSASPETATTQPGPPRASSAAGSGTLPDRSDADSTGTLLAAQLSAVPVASVDDTDEEDLEKLEIAAPAWIAAMWRSTLALVRRLAGGRLPAGECLEVLMAEAAAGGIPGRSDAGGSRAENQGNHDPTSGSGTHLGSGDHDEPDLRSSARHEPRSVTASSAIPMNDASDLRSSARHESRSVTAPSAIAMNDASDLPLSARHESRSVTASSAIPINDASDLPLSARHEPRSVTASSAIPMNDASDLPLSAPAVVQPSYAGPTGEGPRPTPRLSGGLDQDDAIPADPFALDGELRRLLTTRQRHDESLASFLRLVARDGGFRDEGFPCMEAYAFDRFGLSPRNLYYMLSLGRTLEASSGLRNLFLSGALTARQTILVGRVASARSLDAWVVRAGRVSLRRLEEEVAFFRHLEECRPGVWGLLERQPPPEGLVLVPGEGPRLRASARPEGRANSGSFPPAPDPQADGSHRRSSAHFQGNDSRAERFLRALEADEKATPLPGRMVVIRLWVEPGVKKMLHALRASLSEKVGAPLRDWEALALLMKEFWSVWDNQETRRQRKLQPVLERDAWRCTAPGCTSMGTGRLEDHHVKFRSEGGSDDLSNRTSVCRGHHRLIHEGRVRVTGRAPDELLWEMGVTNGREPFLVYLNERRIGGCAK